MGSIQRRWIMAGVALFVLAFGLAGAIAADCTFYSDSQPVYVGGEEACGGSNPEGCTECYEWDNYSSVSSCVTVGDSNCFEEEHQTTPSF